MCLWFDFRAITILLDVVIRLWGNRCFIKCGLSSQTGSDDCLVIALFIICAAKTCSQNVVCAESDAPEIWPRCLLQLSWSQCGSKCSCFPFCRFYYDIFFAIFLEFSITANSFTVCTVVGCVKLNYQSKALLCQHGILNAICYLYHKKGQIVKKIFSTTPLISMVF